MFHKLRCLLRQLSFAGAMLATVGATGALAGGPKARQIGKGRFGMGQQDLRVFLEDRCNGE